MKKPYIKNMCVNLRLTEKEVFKIIKLNGQFYDRSGDDKVYAMAGDMIESFDFDDEGKDWKVKAKNAKYALHLEDIALKRLYRIVENDYKEIRDGVVEFESMTKLEDAVSKLYSKMIRLRAHASQHVRNVTLVNGEYGLPYEYTTKVSDFMTLVVTLEKEIESYILRNKITVSDEVEEE